MSVFKFEKLIEYLVLCTMFIEMREQFFFLNDYCCIIFLKWKEMSNFFVLK